MNATASPYNTLPMSEKIAMKWGSVSVGILGSISNIFTIACIVRYNYLRRKVTNFLIGNLCGCGVLLAIMPVATIFSYSNTRAPTLEFIISTAASVSVLYMSLAIVLLIGVDRAIAIADPVGYKIRITHKKARIIVTLFWISNVVITLGLIVPNMYQSDNPHKIFPPNVYKYGVMPATVVTVCAVVCLYLGILLEFLRQKHKTRLRFSGQFLPAIRRARYLTKMTLFILVIFLATWIPAMVVMARDTPVAGSEDFHAFYRTRYLINAILHASALTNCIVYACTNPEYRRAYRDMLNCGKKPVHPGTCS